MIPIGGLLIILMMTAASVCAEDPLARDNPLPDEAAAGDIDENDGGADQMLIAPLENETTSSGEENSTGDMVISPGPEGSSKATISLDLPLVIIAACVIVALAMIAIAIRRRK